MLPPVSYDTFRSLADGMLLTVIVFALLSFSKKRSIFYVLYALFLVVILIGYQVGDHSYKQGKFKVYESYENEIGTVAALIYAFFMAKIFQVHIKTIFFRRLYISLIIFMISTALFGVFIKVFHYYELVKPLCMIQDTIGVPLYCVILYKIYQLKFNYVKYFFIGSISAITGTHLILFFEINDNLLSHNFLNAFTFENTYHEICLIFEGLFLLIGIASYNNQIDKDKAAIQQQLLDCLLKKNNQQSYFFELQDALLSQLNQEIDTTLQQILELNKKSMALLKNEREETRQNLEAMNILGSQVGKKMRKIIFELDTYSAIEIPFESKANELSKTVLDKHDIVFNIHLNETSNWSLLTEQFELQILNIYENLLNAFVSNKISKEIVVHFSISEKSIFRLIIQDNLSTFNSKVAFENKLSLIEYQIQIIGGFFQYYIENTSQTIIRVDLPMKNYNYQNLDFENEVMRV